MAWPRRALVLAIAALVALAAISPAVQADPADGAPDGRVTLPLDADWEVVRGDLLAPGTDPAVNAAAAGPWTAVTLPHTFNAGDGVQPKPYRGPAWYRRTLTLDPREGAAGVRRYLEFDGAALVTDVWVNGVHLGRHEGGFARFRFDVSSQLRPGANRLVVRVDNAVRSDVAPLGGDYTLYGGLYRSVRLVTTNAVHLDMLDHGASGAYFDARGVTPGQAGLHWTARVANDGAAPLRASVTAGLRDGAGRLVASARRDVLLAPHTVVPVTLDAGLARPHLWQGVVDPYLYTSEVAVVGEGARGGGQGGGHGGGRARTALLDQVRYQVGLRDIKLDPERGLLLNGSPAAVHGVNLHLTYVPGKGTAAQDSDVDRDYRILGELGVTGLRFAHYQHGQHSYDLADRQGYLVWTELPLTAQVDASDAFARNLGEQALELVRQNQHHPSVFVWGLGNEIYKVDAVSARVLDAMQNLVHAEDPGRPTVYANCCAPVDGPQASHTDALGSNVYFGWYDKEFADLGPWLAANHQLRPGTPQAVSEYGAGASVRQQEDPVRRPQANSDWHPEQYQALYHEAAWRQIDAKPWLWASFVWAGFDFPSAGRHEGDTAGINDKGLVSLDRGTRKDAYYWYQANWSAKPMVYITSRRYQRRTAQDAEVKVYTNQDGASLRLNGKPLGRKPAVGHVVSWQVKLAPGGNRIEVEGSATAAAAAAIAGDAVDWRFEPPTP